ncbi:hypothetical protein WJX72_002954 [[Myrmecia] bisecta]|uniref:Transcription initiation factor IIA subunit 2 n=1 Tax=[Myrmecia] bisecta TaxID=41462 RepID=A0AAW1QPU5_9CHLO
MSTLLYRESKLGNCLVDSLDELIEQGKLSGELAMKVMAQFDECFIDKLEHKVTAKGTFKGSLDTYRFCDNVWTFIMSDVAFKINPSINGSNTVFRDVRPDGKVKFVLVDAKLSQKD